VSQFLLLVVVALTVGAVVFGVTVLLTGGDGGLSPAEPDGGAVPLPATRPLAESDIARVRFDTAARGYRMAQVDQAMRRAAYDIGYKDELINVLEAEVDALRSGRLSDAEVLRRAREAAQSAGSPAPEDAEVTAIELGETTERERAIRAAADDGGGDGTGSSTAGGGDEGTTDPDSPYDPSSEADESNPFADSEAGGESGGGESGGGESAGDSGPGGDDDPDGSGTPESDSAVPSRR
jgi:DivIVA domain-containing protein